MFNLFKRHNKNYNPIITTASPADLKNVKDMNTFIIACRDDACVEQSKKRIGHGSPHFNTYTCDRLEECRGECGVYRAT